MNQFQSQIKRVLPAPCHLVFLCHLQGPKATLPYLTQHHVTVLVFFCVTDKALNQYTI